jgi:hypothetical protein
MTVISEPVLKHRPEKNHSRASERPRLYYVPDCDRPHAPTYSSFFPELERALAFSQVRSLIQ